MPDATPAPTLPPRNLRVSPDRIEADLTALAAITDPDRPWTKPHGQRQTMSCQ